MFTSRFFSRTLLASTLALIVLAGCQSTQMPVPATLDANAPLAVIRSDASGDATMKVGAYEAHSFWRIQAETPRTLGAGHDALVSQAGSERYGFTMRLGTTDLWDASCSTNAQRARGGASDLIACTVTAHGQPGDTWTLMLRPMGETRLAGVLQQGDTAYEVRGTNQTASGITSRSQTGYLVGHAGMVLAAVDVTEEGRVWLRPSNDVRETTLLAAVSAALLVTEDIRTA